MIELTLPLKPHDINHLRTGDRVLITGRIFTARDQAHVALLEQDFTPLKGGVIYHSGPIIKENTVIAAGPTTSARMNPYTPELIEKYGIKGIIGKGGMDEKVLESLRGKAIYFSAFGGCAVLAARTMHIAGVHMSEFGMAEAVWELEVSGFPAIVAMDAHGNSIYDDIKNRSEKAYMNLIKDQP